jgi:hypothetical protein
MIRRKLNKIAGKLYLVENGSGSRVAYLRSSKSPRLIRKPSGAAPSPLPPGDFVCLEHVQPVWPFLLQFTLAGYLACLQHQPLLGAFKENFVRGCL